MFPQVREFFFDDDTFTDDLPRAEAIARELGKLGVTWSCNAKANVPRETLKVLKDNGLRLLLVGYESGNQQILHNIKKGMLIDVAKRFTRDCHELGIKIHGTFILGLPGETKETIEQTIKFATEINPHTLQVSLAAPYPGTFLHKQALENGWLSEEHAELIDETGIQIAPLNYPGVLIPRRNLRQRRGVLQALLLPRAEDRLDRGRDGPQPADDEAPAARGRGVLPVHARPENRRLTAAATAGSSSRRTISGYRSAVNEAVERAHRRRNSQHRQPDGGRRWRRRDAVERARRLPGLRVGLHLVVIEGPAISLAARRIARLVGRRWHSFRPTSSGSGVRYYLRPAGAAAIAGGKSRRSSPPLPPPGCGWTMRMPISTCTCTPRSGGC